MKGSKSLRAWGASVGAMCFFLSLWAVGSIILNSVGLPAANGRKRVSGDRFTSHHEVGNL